MDEKKNEKSYDEEKFGKVLGSILQQQKEQEERAGLEATKALHDTFVQLMKSGFTEMQALKIVSDLFTGIIVSSMNKII